MKLIDNEERKEEIPHPNSTPITINVLWVERTRHSFGYDVQRIKLSRLNT